MGLLAITGETTTIAIGSQHPTSLVKAITESAWETDEIPIRR